MDLVAARRGAAGAGTADAGHGAPRAAAGAAAIGRSRGRRRRLGERHPYPAAHQHRAAAPPGWPGRARRHDLARAYRRSAAACRIARGFRRAGRGRRGLPLRRPGGGPVALRALPQPLRTAVGHGAGGRGMSSPTDLRPFSPRTLFLLIGIGALAFAAMAWLMISADDRAARNAEVAPSTDSRSAIGFRAFVQLMQKLDVPVAPTVVRGVPSLQIVLEPRLPDLRALLATGYQTLVVLPKWRGYTPPYGDHLTAVSLIDRATVQTIARVVADDAEIVRTDSAGPWHHDVFHGDPTLGHPQLLRSGKLCPLVSSGGDMLIARVCRQPSIFVLADPDVIANHGLWRGDNAVLAMSFVSLMRNGNGPVVTPGALIRQPVKSKPNVFGLAFEPPFVLITIAA